MKFLCRFAAAAALMMALAAPQAAAEKYALKTNLIGWATLSPNIGAEMALGDRSSVQIFGLINPFDIGKDKHCHMWAVQPEYRYWLCQPFNGHFFGVHLLGGQYNIKNMDLPLVGLPKLTGEFAGRHTEGWYVGAGITYGYQWMLSRHWNIEASLGVGYAYSPYKYYGRCDRVIEDKVKHYFGPTKLAVSLMYIF